MAISQAVINTQTTADSYFYQADGVTPFVVSQPVSFAVRTQTGLLVSSGSATQDPNNAAHWSASFTIPSTAPATNSGEFYTILFTATNGTNTSQQTFNFSVSSQIQTDPTDTAIIVLVNQPFTINLTLPYSSLLTLTVRFVNVNGAVVNVPTITTNINNPVPTSNGQYIYQIPISATDSASMQLPGYGVFYYFAYINYTTPAGSQETDVQMVYIANTTCLKIMNDIRRQVDRIRNNDIIPQLRITDIDLLHYTLQGVEYVNSQPPANCLFNLQSLPVQFYIYAQKAGSMQLLEAQYLAQGMTAVELSGQAVSLSQDVTQYIVQMIEMLRTDLQSVGLAKNHYMRSGGSTGVISAIGGVWGPVANLVYNVSPYMVSGAFPVLPFLG